MLLCGVKHPKHMTKKIRPFSIESRLPYPTITHSRANDGVPPLEEYVIPKAHRQKVLEKMYPFVGPPKLTDVMIDIHCDKHFVVSEFKVVRELGRNWLTSPYYFESGGTVIDWWPVEEDEISKQIRSGKRS